MTHASSVAPRVYRPRGVKPTDGRNNLAGRTNLDVHSLARRSDENWRISQFDKHVEGANRPQPQELGRRSLRFPTRSPQLMRFLPLGPLYLRA
jgi:hypothetical protein